MSDRSAVHRPPPLRKVLAAGGDLTAAGLWLEGLAEELGELPFMPPKARAEKAALYRGIAEDLIAHGEQSQYLPVWSDGTRGVRSTTLQLYTARYLYSAEIFEDEALAEHLRQALPPDVRHKERCHRENYRRPHPLEVKVPARWWRCNNCGASFDQGEQEAVVVGYREAVSLLEYEITYCAACIALVAEVARQGYRS